MVVVVIVVVVVVVWVAVVVVVVVVVVVMVLVVFLVVPFLLGEIGGGGHVQARLCLKNFGRSRGAMVAVGSWSRRALFKFC